MPSYNDKDKIRDIVKGQVGSIKRVPLPPGSPSWDEVMDETWGAVKRKARAAVIGYRTIKKVIGGGRFTRGK